MELFTYLSRQPALDLESEDGAAISVEIVGFAAFFAAVLIALIAAAPQIGALIVAAIQAALQAVSYGG